jgi:hypothetical protein
MRSSSRRQPRLEVLEDRTVPGVLSIVSEMPPAPAPHPGVTVGVGPGAGTLAPLAPHPGPTVGADVGTGTLAALPPRPGNHRGHRLALRGQVIGTWTARAALPDMGTIQELTGTGVVQPLGTVRATGELRMPGFVVIGRAEGVLALEARGGGITLHLVSPTEKGFGGTLTVFRYTIVGATGQYAGDWGSGTAVLREAARPAAVCPPGALCPQPIRAPGFTLTIQSP